MHSLCIPKSTASAAISKLPAIVYWGSPFKFLKNEKIHIITLNTPLNLNYNFIELLKSGVKNKTNVCPFKFPSQKNNTLHNSFRWRTTAHFFSSFFSQWEGMQHSAVWNNDKSDSIHVKNPFEFTWFFPNVFTLLKGKQEEIVIKQDNRKKLNSNFATLSLPYV